jgi:hypothetical protein
MKQIALGMLLVLAACATPPQCDGRLAEVMAEIAERERAVSRGYRVLPAQDGKTLVRLCGSPELLCTDNVQQPRSAQRVVVDIAAERAALAQLRNEETALRAQGQVCL